MDAGFEFRLLGPFEARCGDRRLAVPAGKLRTVLAALLLTPGTVVTPERFAHWLGDDLDRKGWTARMQSYVWRLREILAPHPGGRELVRTLAGGYLLDVDPSTVDYYRFRELVRSTEAVEPAAAVPALTEALALWRGPALTGISSSALHEEIGAVLDEDRLSALERRIEGELVLGGHAALVGELQSLVHRYPLREGLWRSLMLALHGSGRQAEALAAYERVRSHLVETLGIDPSPALRGVHRLVLGADGAPAAEEASARELAESLAEHAATAPWVSACALPPDVVNLVGREKELDEIAEWLTADSLAGPGVAVVHGLSGIGKSAIAVRLAHRLRDRFPDGQHWLRLGATAEVPQQAFAAMGDLLYATGVRAKSIPSAPGARESAYRTRLNGRRLLVVLDDATDAGQVDAVITGSERCAFVVTGKQALRSLSGRVRNFRVEELSHEHGFDLLVRMIGAGRVGEEEDAVHEIVDHCGGHPLALRVIAARIGALPGRRIGSVVPRLRDARRRLDQFVTPDQQVRSSFALGYASMPEWLQRTFRGLSLLGEHTFASWVAGLLAGDDDGDRVVAELVDRGMLTPGGLDETGEPRYQLHSLLALYAEEQAVAHPDERHAAVRRLVDGYLVFSEKANAESVVLIAEMVSHPGLPKISAEEVEGITADAQGWFRAERHNLAGLAVHAARAGFSSDAKLLVDRISSTEENDGNWRRLVELYATVRDAAREHGDESAALRAEVARINMATTGGDVAQLIADYTECLPALEKSPFVAEHAQSLANLAVCHREQNNQAGAREAAERAVDLARTAPNGLVLAYCLRVLGGVMSQFGDYEKALVLFESALDTAAKNAVNDVSNRIGEATIRFGVAASAVRHGDLPRAQAEAETVLTLLAGSNRHLTMGHAAMMLSRLHSGKENWAEARTWAARAVRVLVAMGDERGQAHARHHLATVLAAQEQYDSAIAELRVALPIMEKANLAAREEAANLLARISDSRS
ncbi:NB-ARC domain-containing protein [Allokutzneria sp. A3M-2-11 16]|uniref:AfsR/SARP family transcriptional regulator n=1 Tax=Allokutzneria sp. A3M-2-11 16 TaxID=2962043 RepID=UPI0020B6EF69|nr:BTAD domain-containing putative transcriptional regulator [Allokutzneria sp. A3M-2-11 16]MCP3805044.1 NB-ARC domain-containing protein [Allokutzneria sp. A3M-2-11 16]